MKVILWTETPNGIFSIKSAWESVRTRGPRVDWHKVVWFSKRIPRHAVILWLAIRRKLSTRDILASIGLSRDTRCVLCGNEGESHDHLFFSCPFSEGIWRLLCSKCNLPWSNLDWGETIQWMVSNFKGKSLSLWSSSFTPFEPYCQVNVSGCGVLSLEGEKCEDFSEQA